MSLGVHQPTPAVVRMREHWKLVSALLGGTARMQKECLVGGADWIVRLQDEDEKGYEARVKSAILHGSFEDTVRTLSGKPFGKPVTITPEELDPRIERLRSDADRQQSSIGGFERKMLQDSIAYGFALSLVDMPKKPAGATAEIDGRFAPFFVRIDPERFLGVVPKMRDDNSRYVAELRYQEVEEIQKGETVEEIPVTVIWTDDGAGKVECRRVPEKGSALLPRDYSDPVQIDFPKIPLVVQYANHLGFLKTAPPLSALADANLQHFRNNGAQEYILETARLPVLVLKDDGDLHKDRPVVLGRDRLLRLDPDGSASYLEVSGEGIELGGENLDRIEKRMEVLGARPMLERSGVATATSAGINADDASSDLDAWVMVAEKACVERFSLAYQWINQELPEDFSVSFFKDYGLPAEQGSRVERLIKLHLAGALSKESLLRQCQNAGDLDDTFSVEDELAENGDGLDGGE